MNRKPNPNAQNGGGRKKKTNKIRKRGGNKKSPLTPKTGPGVETVMGYKKLKKLFWFFKRRQLSRAKRGVKETEKKPGQSLETAKEKQHKKRKRRKRKEIRKLTVKVGVKGVGVKKKEKLRTGAIPLWGDPTSTKTSPPLCGGESLNQLKPREEKSQLSVKKRTWLG